MEDEVKDLPPIPETIYLPTGMTVDTSSSVWLVRSYKNTKQHRFNWELLDRSDANNGFCFSQRCKHLLKLFIAHRLTQVKAGTVQKDFSVFNSFQRWFREYWTTTEVELSREGFEWSDFDEVIANTFAEWSRKKFGYNHGYVACIKSFYSWGLARQYPEFNLDTYQSMKSIRIWHNVQGQLVQARDVLRGPLSSEEKTLLVQAIKAGKGTDIERGIAMLFLELGLRPISVTKIKNKHLKRIETNKLILYQIDIPRAKKRNHLEETKRRPISEHLGMLLETLQGSDGDAPLFALWDKHPDQGVTALMKRFVRAANIISPRTGKLLKLQPRRMRYTLASHLAEEGASKFHIAEVLDHAGLQSAGIYIETSPTIARQVALATDATIKPLIDRFLGKLIEPTSQEVSGDTESANNSLILASTAHLRLPVLNAGGIGICGRNVRQDGLCQLFPPFSCYLCPSFLALRTGPHKEQLESIEQFVLESKGFIDDRIIMQLDEIRQAIQEVLKQIEQETFRGTNANKDEVADAT